MQLSNLDFRRVRLVTFDMGGTLLTPHPSVGEVYAEVLARHGVNIAPALLNQRFQVAFKELNSSVQDAVINEASELVFWGEIVRRCVSPECPVDLIQEIFTESWREFASARRWCPLPGAAETLSALASNDSLQLAVFSNWDSRLHQVMAELGWERFFHGVFISSEIGAKKPDPRAFRAIETAFRLPAVSCLHVGDSFTQDYRAALDAGWQAILVGTPPTNEKSPAISQIAQLTELCAYLK